MALEAVLKSEIEGVSRLETASNSTLSDSEEMREREVREEEQERRADQNQRELSEPVVTISSRLYEKIQADLSEHRREAARQQAEANEKMMASMAAMDFIPSNPSTVAFFPARAWRPVGPGMQFP